MRKKIRKLQATVLSISNRIDQNINAKAKLEQDTNLLAEQTRKLPAVSNEVKKAATGYSKLKTAVETLERASVDNFSGISAVISRLSAVNSSTTVLEMATGIENATEAVTAILNDFFQSSAVNEPSVRNVVGRLASSLDSLKANKGIVEILQFLETRDDYHENLARSIDDWPSQRRCFIM